MSDKADHIIRPVSEAADWFERVNAGQLSDDEMAAFEHWLEDDRNRADYADCARLWSAMEVPEFWAFDQDLVAREKTAPVQNRWSIPRWMGAVAASFLLVLVGVVSYMSVPDGETIYETSVGEQRRVVLADSSAVHLNTDTELEVRYSDRSRSITLLKGEVLVEVEPDPTRPFEVETRAGIVRALGTEFTLRTLDDGRIRLAVSEGVVELVHPAAQPSQEPPRVHAGQVLHFSALVLEPTIENADVTMLHQWRQGLVSFSGEPLGDVIREVARYTTDPVLIDNDSVAAIRVSGIFRIGEVDGFLNGLAEVFPVTVTKTQSGSTIISGS